MLNSVEDLKSNKAVGHLVMTEAERPLDSEGEINWDATDNMRRHKPIMIDNDAEMIGFKMMTKPASEGGTGCQFTDLIEVALHQLKYLNKKFHCYENDQTINHLDFALYHQKKRTEYRIARQVEGKDIK